MADLRLGNLTELAWEAFHTFPNEAQKIRTLVEKLPVPATPQD